MESEHRPPPQSKVDIIWNTTLLCGWDCEVCCVDAVHVRRAGERIILRSKGLQHVEEHPFRRNQGSIFEQALRLRQAAGHELDLAGKLRVLDHLEGFDPKIDISGGDPLAVRENFALMEAAARRFGRARITLTATGAGLGQWEVEEIAPLIGEFNFTYDSPTADGGSTRPDRYASGNLRRAARFAALGVPTRAECPLTRENIADGDTLAMIYRKLHDAGINKLLLMRMFPVGRGAERATVIPTGSDYRKAIDLFHNLEATYGTPRVSLQCALKWFDPETRKRLNQNPCDLVRESFGLTASGILLASPWAVDRIGAPMHEAWVLGNLSSTPLSDILATEKAKAFSARLDQNHGHCKILAFIASAKTDPTDRIFDHADPLYGAPAPDQIASAAA